jgi:N-acetylglucosamine kinase-like BadF-type ATPase
MFFVSVDGGATKTIAVCYDDNGRIHGIGVSGPSNFRNIGIEETGKNLEVAIKRALERSHLDSNNISKYSFALAGVKDSARSTDIINGMVRHLSISAPFVLLNDGEAGFNCRFPGTDGIIAAPGTGMIAYARHGDIFGRTSGWGWFIGDEGGAFYTARRAIEECAKSYDGRLNVDSQLPEALMEYFHVDEPRKLVNEIYSDRIDIRGIAKFTTIISKLSQRGDDLSSRLIRESAFETANSVIALKKMYFSDTDAVFSGYGGVFRAGELYWKTVLSRVENEFPDMNHKPPLFGYHAVLGSIYLTLKDMGIGISFDLEVALKDFNLKIDALSRGEKEDNLFIFDST